MILVLSLNTAIDRTMVVRSLHLGEVHRAQSVHLYAGGKGLNVARALRRLEEPVRVIGWLGGSPERFVRSRCADLGIEQRWINIEGESRTCVIVLDLDSGEQTVVNEPGPRVSEAETEQLLAELRRSAQPGDILCISGSTPPGVPDGLYAHIVTELQRQDVRVLVDTSGPALQESVAVSPWAIAPNYDECLATFGGNSTPDGITRRLMGTVEHVLVTLGAEGVLYGQGDQVVRALPPRVQAVNAVGSGDAFVAGWLTGMNRGDDPEDAIRLAVACGASNASRLEPEIGTVHEVQSLLAQVEIKAERRT